jgi:pimeloyl-ACP methyl ester carboxylesterase
MTEIILDAMPRAQGAVIDGAGHMSPLTHTEQVNGEIERHLKSF